MYCVGLAGLIGSGKSTVGEVLVGLGVPLYDCDSRAKELMFSALREPIIELLGAQSFRSDGQIDRVYLAQKVFADKSLLQQLEHIVHPAVDVHLRDWINHQHDVPYVVVESAILIGNVIERMIDHLVVVTADRGVIIDRVMRRDGVTRDQVECRLAAQMDVAEVEARADTVIITCEQELVVPKVVALHEKLLTLSKLSTK